MTLRLSLETIENLPDTIRRPLYRREDISPGIMHIGVGNFHRAHQAVYLDDLFNLGRDHDWAIIGAGFRLPDAAMREALEAQDWLTSVVELEPGANHARITGVMVEFLPVQEDRRAILSALADPAIRIVSLTVTEGGYCIDPASGMFDPNHPEICHDAAHADAPLSVFGVLVAALKARRAAGLRPFTIMSCDNLPGNGHVAQAAVVGLADLIDADLASWIEGEVAFPNSMVDRITPATTDVERNKLKESFGVEDRWPVFCEPFRQWVMEDRFPAGRPAFDEVGVTLTDDVASYELMKIRMLNGGHAAIAYPSALMGLRTAPEAMANPLVAGFFDKLEREEIIPVVPAVPGVDLTDYLDLLKRRFANPEIKDAISRLCQDGSNRQPKFILPTIRDRLAQDQGIKGLALESALWCRYCFGETENGVAIAIEDVNADRLRDAARQARTNPEAFLSLRDVYGDLADHPIFRAAFANSLSSLWSKGVAATLANYLDATGEPA